MNVLKRLFGRSETTSLPISAQQTSRSLSQLLGDIESKIPAVKATAMMSVSLLDESAIDPLLQTIRTAKGLGPKWAAADSLGILGKQRAVEPLCEIIKNAQEPFLFSHVAEALGRLADQRAVDVLIPLLENFSALAPKKDPTDPHGLRDRDRVVKVFIHGYSVRKGLAEALESLQDERAVPVLLRTLEDDESYVVNAGAEALAGLGTVGIDGLISEFKGASKSEHLHSAVARALEQCDALNERQLDSMIALIEDGSVGDEIRWLATDIIGAAGDRRALMPLLASLDDRSPRVRLGAARALGKLGDHRAFDRLIAVLNDQNVDVRKSCCEALGLLGDARAIQVLSPWLTDADDGVRMSAAFALARLHDGRAFDQLVGCLRVSQDKSQRGRAADALAELGDRRAIDPLLNLLANSEESLRSNSIRALGKLGDPRGIEAIAKCLNDSKLEVQLAAAETLAARGDGRGFEVMFATLLTDNLEHHLLPSIRGLGALADLRAVPALILRLRGSRGKVRKAIIASVAKLGAPAEEALQPLLADPRPLVRSDAEIVLDRIAAQVAESDHNLEERRG